MPVPQAFDLIASADFARRRMTHRSLGVGGYGFWGTTGLPVGVHYGNLLGGLAGTRHGWAEEEIVLDRILLIRERFGCA